MTTGTTLTGLTVRYATADNVPTLRALVERAYRGDSARTGWTHEADLLDDERTTHADLTATIADPASRVLLGYHDNVLIGTVTITDCGGSLSYLGMLCVDPACQAGGIGSALIAAAEQAAQREFGAQTMEMTVIDRRADVIAWYQRRGYRDSGEVRPFPVPGDHPFAMVVLTRDLA
ncbi:GNAT family N-acetyltransferase [Novosphingobium sp.]|uniref:GNAT family N-acetyltransferase n=1 Tax=Novosphingobium sp. TaxID=1874826 RepID=UPI003342691C